MCQSSQEGGRSYHVVGFGAGVGSGTNEFFIRQNGPCEGCSNDRSETPPTRHQCDQPLLVTWQELEENGGVKDEVTTRAETRKSRRLV